MAPARRWQLEPIPGEDMTATGTRLRILGFVVAMASVWGCSSGGSGNSTGGAGKGGAGTGATGTAGAGAAGMGAGGAGGTGTGGAGTGGGVTGGGGAAGFETSSGAAGAGGTPGTAGTGAAGVTGAAGSTSDGGAGTTGAAGSNANMDAGAFTLSSTSLKTVDGGLVFPAAQSAPMNQSPELTWTTPPAGTMSLAWTVYDLTMKNTHFILYDIPVTPMTLPAGLPRGAMPTMPAGAKWISAFGGTPGYEGPGGGAVDDYEIVLWAIKDAHLNVGTMSLNQLHSTLLPMQSLGKAQLLAKGTRNGL
jgi:phosphatidylethanolamine-binding protein (PEBP) family uncharacterized protein